MMMMPLTMMCLYNDNDENDDDNEDNDDDDNNDNDDYDDNENDVASHCGRPESEMNSRDEFLAW